MCENRPMNIESVLRGMGLEEKETVAYLKLLELGEGSPLEIARQTGIKRPTAYLVLHALTEKGFATKVVRERKTLFSPQHPKKLLVDMETKLKDLSEAIPQLESLTKSGERRPRILLFEGIEALDRAYDGAFSAKGEVLFMSTLGLSKKLFPRTFKKLDDATFSPEFKVRELVDESPDGKAYANTVQNTYRMVRIIPKKYLPFETDIGIFSNTVLITSAGKESFTIGIESPKIAQAFRTLYETLWQVSNKAAKNS